MNDALPDTKGRLGSAVGAAPITVTSSGPFEGASSSHSLAPHPRLYLAI